MNEQIKSINQQIIDDLSALPGIKYLIPVLAASPNDPMSKWLLNGYITNDIFNKYIKTYQQNKEIRHDILFNVTKDEEPRKILIPEILKLLSELPKETIESIVAKRSLINAVSGLNRVIGTNMEYTPDRSIVNYLATGELDNLDLDLDYVEFIVNPDLFIRGIINELLGYDYDKVLEHAVDAIGYLMNGNDYERFRKVPHEDQLAYILELDNIPELENDVKVIYNYFYK